MLSGGGLDPFRGKAHGVDMRRAVEARRIRRGFRLALGLVWLPWTALAEAPGDLLPIDASVPRALGSVSFSRVAADGSVLVVGDFTAVDGVVRSGLARLTASGELDEGFEPEVVGISGRPALGPYTVFGQVASGGWLDLSDGTWIHSFGETPLAYQADGRMDARYDFLGGSDGWAEALFEAGGLLYLARHKADGTRLEARHVDTQEPLPMAGQEAWPAPFEQVAPAGAGRLWVLGREPAGDSDLFMSFPDCWLFRVEADGALDPTFDPVELSGRYSYRLSPRAGGGYRLVTRDEARWMYWPSPTSQAIGVELHDGEGGGVASRQIVLPLGIPILVAEEADGSLLYGTLETRQGRDVCVLVRMGPTGEMDPAFRVDLSAASVQVLGDGRIQHSHIHRVMPDGTPDPTWHIPRLETDPDMEVVGAFEDGGIVVWSTQGVADAAGHSLMVLGPSGQPDLAFQPPADLPPVTACHMVRDGHSLVLILEGIHEFADGTQTRILKLRRDGAIDPDSPRYVPADGWQVSIPGMGGGEPVPFVGLFSARSLSDGGFLVHYAQVDREVPLIHLLRLGADGAVDPAFSFEGEDTCVEAPFVLSDDRFIVRNRLHAANGAFVREFEYPPYGMPWAEGADGRLMVRYFEGDATQLALLDLATGTCAAFQTPFLDGTRIQQALPLPDGKWMVEGDLRTSGGTRSWVRLLEDGRIDPSFQAPEVARVLPAAPGLTELIVGGERVPATLANRSIGVHAATMMSDEGRGGLLVGGSFTSAGGELRKGLAWLSLSNVGRFDEWLESATRGLEGELPSDPEERIRTYLEAYALGVDPLAGGGQGLRVASGGGRQFRLGLNPDAQDVDVAIEVSDDLASWRMPESGELTLERSRSDLRIQLSEEAPDLFLRVRYRSEP